MYDLKLCMQAQTKSLDPETRRESASSGWRGLLGDQSIDERESVNGECSSRATAHCTKVSESLGAI